MQSPDNCLNATTELKANIARHRKYVFNRAKLSVKCFQERDASDKNKCVGCKAFKICRAIADML